MNRDEVKALLALASSVDPKVPQPDPAVVSGWEVMLADVDASIAAHAVRGYYRSESYLRSREPISPADVVQWWNAHRGPSAAEQRGLRQVQARARSAAEDPDRWHAGVDYVLARLAKRRAIAAGEDRQRAGEVATREAAARRRNRRRACPHCGAQPGRACVTHRGVELRGSTVHDSRLTGVEVAGRASAATAAEELAKVTPGAMPSA